MCVFVYNIIIKVKKNKEVVKMCKTAIFYCSTLIANNQATHFESTQHKVIQI